MANGFFLGGAAEGMESSRKSALEESRLHADVGLRTRGLDLQERQVARSEQNDLTARADKDVADLMTDVRETIKHGLAVGKDPATIRAAVAPLVQIAGQIKARIGGNPAALVAQVDAMLTGPTGIEAATAAGRAEGTRTGTAQVTAAEVITGGGENAGIIIDPAKRGEAENALRDDYVKQTATFRTVNDYYSSIKTADDTSAGDLTVIFGLMKLLDPSSNVMPGEQATVQNTTSVPDRIRTLYNSLLEGKTRSLGVTARAEAIKQAEKIYQSRALQHDRTTTQFANIAKRRGLNVNNVIVDVLPPEASTAGPKIPPPPPGFNVVPR